MEILAIPAATVKTCVFCARKKLAELVQGGQKRLDIRVDPPRRDPRKKVAGTRWGLGLPHICLARALFPAAKWRGAGGGDQG